MLNMLCALTLSVPGETKPHLRQLLARLLLDNYYYVNYNFPSNGEWGAILGPDKGYVAHTLATAHMARSPKSRQYVFVVYRRSRLLVWLWQ